MGNILGWAYLSALFSQPSSLRSRHYTVLLRGLRTTGFRGLRLGCRPLYRRPDRGQFAMLGKEEKEKKDVPADSKIAARAAA